MSVRRASPLHKFRTRCFLRPSTKFRLAGRGAARPANSRIAHGVSSKRNECQACRITADPIYSHPRPVGWFTLSKSWGAIGGGGTIGELVTPVGRRVGEALYEGGSPQQYALSKA